MGVVRVCVGGKERHTKTGRESTPRDTTSTNEPKKCRKTAGGTKRHRKAGYRNEGAEHQNRSTKHENRRPKKTESHRKPKKNHLRRDHRRRKKRRARRAARGNTRSITRM